MPERLTRAECAKRAKRNPDCKEGYFAYAREDNKATPEQCYCCTDGYDDVITDDGFDTYKHGKKPDKEDEWTELDTHCVDLKTGKDEEGNEVEVAWANPKCTGEKWQKWHPIFRGIYPAGPNVAAQMEYEVRDYLFDGSMDL